MVVTATVVFIVVVVIAVVLMYLDLPLYSGIWKCIHVSMELGERTSWME